MKFLQYKFVAAEVNRGTEENPDIELVLVEKQMGWSEPAEEIAKKEAYNGEYEIFDDGKPEPAPASDQVTWDELDAAYQEGVDSV